MMIAPALQGAGLGTDLIARLQEYAISRGVLGFVTQILPRNTAMLRLAASASDTVTTAPDEGTVHMPSVTTIRYEGSRSTQWSL
jgi:GNAT superfamily N-acetyltransferase